MGEVISLWPLTGIAVIVVGFLLRFNPVLVVIIAGIVTGLAAHMPIARDQPDRAITMGREPARRFARVGNGIDRGLIKVDAAARQATRHRHGNL